MKKIFNNQILKLEDFIKETDEQNCEITSIGFYPKVCDNIKFDFKILDDKEDNRILRNVFQQFYIMYIFKKLEDYINYFELPLNSNSKNSNFVNTIYTEYSNFDFEIQKAKYNNTNFVLLVKYKNKDNILLFEKRKNTGANIITQNIHMCSKYVSSIFFYIFPSFLKWIDINNIDIKNVYEWSEFLTYNELLCGE